MGWNTNAVSLADPNKLHPKKLSFTVKHKILRIVSKKKIKYQSNVNNYRKNYKLQFAVKKKDWRPHVISDIIGEMFCAFYHFQNNAVYLRLCGLPHGIGAIQLKWTLRIKFTDLVFSTVQTLSYAPRRRDSKLLIAGLQEKEDVYEDMEEMIFLIDIQILCEYDLKGNVIGGTGEIEDEWDRFIEKEKQENKKMVVNKKKPKKFNSNIKQTQSQDRDRNVNVSVGAGNYNNDNKYRREMARLWMKDQVKLMQYFDILVANGYDNMDAISTLNLRHLEVMGIKKMGHRHQIMKHVQELKCVPIVIRKELDEMREEIKQIKSELSGDYGCIWTTLTNLRYFFDSASV